MNPLHLGIVVLALTLSAVVACTSESCEEREAVGYPEMEAMATSTLSGVDYSLERTGPCEDTRMPRTVLNATVNEWPNRRVANTYFKQAGWVRVSGRLNSPDGAYYVDTITTWEADNPRSFETVLFFEHVDDDWDD